MTKRAKTKRQIDARIYVFTVDGQQHELKARDARDLVKKVTNLVPGIQTKQMAQLAWTSGEQADLTGGQYRLVCVGQMVSELWGKLPKPARKKVGKGDQAEAASLPVEEEHSGEAKTGGDAPLL